MRAIQFSATGGPEVLQVVEIDTPQLELAVRDRIARTADAINLT